MIEWKMQNYLFTRRIGRPRWNLLRSTKTSQKDLGRRLFQSDGKAKTFKEKKKTNQKKTSASEFTNSSVKLCGGNVRAAEK